jgi:ribosome assembly protein SQT1
MEGKEKPEIDEDEQSDYEDAEFIEEEEIGEEIEIPLQTPGESGIEAGVAEMGVEEGDDEEFEDDSVQGFFSHTDSVFTVSINRSRPELVLTGGGDNKAYLWNQTNGETVKELGGHEDSVVASGFNFNGTLMATGGMEGVVKIWDVASGALVQNLQAPDDIIWLSWHPKGNVILAGTEGGTAWMWNAQTGTNLQVFSGHGGQCSCGGFTPDGKKIASGSVDGTVRVWNPKTGETEFLLAGHGFHTEGVVSMDFHPLSASLITGSTDHTVCVSNLNTGKILGMMRGHTESVESVGFCRSLPLAASGSVDNTIRVWDLTTLQHRLTCVHEDAVTQIQWHPSEPLIFSCSVDRTLRLWDARTGQNVRTWNGHTDSILSFDVTPDGKRLVSASDDHTALVFEL